MFHGLENTMTTLHASFSQAMVHIYISTFNYLVLPPEGFVSYVFKPRNMFTVKSLWFCKEYISRGQNLQLAAILVYCYMNSVCMNKNKPLFHIDDASLFTKKCHGC